MYIKKGEANTHPVLARNRKYVQCTDDAKEVKESTRDTKKKKTNEMAVYIYIYI